MFIKLIERCLISLNEEMQWKSTGFVSLLNSEVVSLNL